MVYSFFPVLLPVHSLPVLLPVLFSQDPGRGLIASLSLPGRGLIASLLPLSLKTVKTVISALSHKTVKTVMFAREASVSAATRGPSRPFDLLPASHPIFPFFDIEETGS